MKEKRWRRRCLAVFLLQTLVVIGASNAKQCTRDEFKVLGVFDDSDTDSVRSFRNSLDKFSKLVHRGASQDCPPKIARRELILNDQMPIEEVIKATANVFSDGKICYMIYSSQGSNGLLALEHALGSDIPVVSTVPKKMYHSRDDHQHYLYDPAKVISLNERSARSTKLQVILDFLLKLGLKEFVTITNAELDDIIIASSLKDLVRSHNLEMEWFVIPAGDPYLQVIPSAKSKFEALKAKPHSFVIITNDILWMDIIFHVAATTGNTGPEYSWLIISDMRFEVVSSATFPQAAHTIQPRVRHDLANSDYVEDAVEMLRYTWKKLVKTPLRSCPTSKWIRRQLPSISFHGKTGSPVVFNHDGQRSQDIYDVSVMYTVAMNEPAKIIPQGNWSNGTLAVTLEEQLPKLKVVIVEYAPYIMSQHKLSPHEPCKSSALSCFKTVKKANGKEGQEERCCYGFAIDALRMVANNMKFTPELIFNEDGIYGVQGDNGSWNGIVRDLMEGKADMSPDLFPTSSRADVLDFTEPYMPTGIALLVREMRRNQKEIYWTSFMRPFTTKLWSFVSGAVGVLIAFLWFADKVSPSISDRKIFHWNAPFCLDNAVCYVLQLTFGRPADEKKPRTNGARLTSVIFGLAMMIILASYSANLAAFLIVNDMTTPVDNIHHEKIKNPPPNFHYGTLDGSYMDNFFKTSSKEYFKGIWSIMEKQNVGSLIEGVKKVRSGELDVFIGDSVGLQFEALNDPYCELKMVGEPFAMTGASFAVKKGSPYLTQLAVALGQVKSEGLTDFIQKFWVKRFTCNKVVPPAQLHLQDLSGLFLQLTIAVLLCVFCNFVYSGWLHLMKVRRDCTSKKRARKEEDLEFKRDKVRPEFEPLRETNL